MLTPAYEQHFRERRAEIDEYGEQRYDRLTNCEYPGVPRWLWEPYIKEFVHLPHQSWLMNDIPSRQQELEPDAPTIVICHHGVRSAQVAAYLEGNGFSHLYNLSGGVDAWAKEVDSSMAIY